MPSPARADRLAQAWRDGAIDEVLDELFGGASPTLSLEVCLRLDPADAARFVAAALAAGSVIDAAGIDPDDRNDARLLRRLRQDARIKLRDVGHRLGIAEPTVQRWETSTSLGAERFHRLLSALVAEIT